MANIRSRKWTLTIHENDDALQEVIRELKGQENGNIDPKIAFIQHNEDVDENGELKLNHYHVVLEYENARAFESIQKTFKGAHIEKCANMNASIQYLTHKNHPNKHQYDFNEITTNDTKWLETSYNAIIVKNDLLIQTELMERIFNGTYNTFYDILVSNEYDWKWLQQRAQMINLIFAQADHKKWIAEHQRKDENEN